ncbi:unnamed protein product [Caenorhabditis angaria]|uniref:Uncharacterized protein n=1 Tax=Caenorhabditis angaria TaxID=860376 RepID=A0A9P1IIZ7_9PELO|nr:unnamed protein product [Caenorhabditis angaria]
MFKNLKNRLDSEAEKIKQSVQQYGGQVAAQVGQYRQAMNEQQTTNESGSSNSKKIGETSIDDSNQITETSSAMMSEIPEADLLGLGLSDIPQSTTTRQRTFSGDSTESTFSSLLHSLPSVLTSALETIPSDSESVASDAFSVRSSNDPNSRLKQKLLNYKEKYRDAVQRHNKLVDDVNNTKMVLEKTQDEYLKKSGKYEGKSEDE